MVNKYFFNERVIASYNKDQFFIIPTFGIIKKCFPFRKRIAFGFGFWLLSIGLGKRLW